MTQEALKLAQIALEDTEHSNFKRRRLDALIAIKQALAQPERPWVGLTDEDITKIDQGLYPTWKDEVQAVEARLKELNNG